MPDSNANAPEINVEEFNKLKEFHNDVAPLAEYLRNNPVLLKEIAEGKANDGWLTEANKAIEASKVKPEPAVAVPEKKTEEKPDLKKEIEAEVGKMVAPVQEKLDEIQTKAQIAEFMSVTPDFETYAPQMVEWLDKNPQHEDLPIEDVYKIVKMSVLTEKSKAEQAKAEDEANKAAAAAAAGGQGSASGQAGKADPFDAVMKAAKGSSGF